MNRCGINNNVYVSIFRIGMLMSEKSIGINDIKNKVLAPVT